MEEHTESAVNATMHENEAMKRNPDNFEKRERAPKAKQGKIIVRNLGFDLREKHLKNVFSPFGPIKEITVPLNQSTNQNRGFAFIEYETRQ